MLKKIIFLFLLTTQVVFANSGEPFEGYTLFTPLEGRTGDNGESMVYLLDMDGEVFHEWKFPGIHGNYAFWDGENMVYRGGFEAKPDNVDDTSYVYEVDWDGNILWEYNNPLMHHDMARKADGNFLVIVWEKMTNANKARLDGSAKLQDEMWTDVIYEIDYDTGEVVWEWHIQDELTIEDYEVSSEGNEWTHTNAVEYVSADNLINGEESMLLSFHNLNLIVLVSLETGNVDWEFGPDELYWQHDPTYLDSGNILVFNNGKQASRVLEINYQTKEIVWEYEAPGFFSRNISGAQRLDNGNTLITEGAEGRIFEVNEEGDVIWEYQNEFGGTGLKDNGVFKAARYTEDELGLGSSLIKNKPDSSVSGETDIQTGLRYDEGGFVLILLFVYLIFRFLKRKK